MEVGSGQFVLIAVIPYVVSNRFVTGDKDCILLQNDTQF